METNDAPNKKLLVPRASAILDDGTIVEMTFRPDLRRTLFAIFSGGRWTSQDAIDLGPDARLVPFSANNNLIKNEVVLLPSDPQILGNRWVITFWATRGQQPTELAAKGSTGKSDESGAVKASKRRLLRCQFYIARWMGQE